MTTTETSYAVTPQLGEKLKRYQNTAAFVGLVFLALLVAGYFLVGPQQFFRSYLVGFWFWFGVGAGSLLILMTQYLTGGAWGAVIRKPLEAGAKTLYVMVLGFLPLLLGAHTLYWWTTPAGQADKVIQAKHLYLNEPFLWVRWVIYAAFLFLMTRQLTKWSKLEEETKSTDYSGKMEALSAPGVVAFFLLMTFCAVDYLMTLEPHWYSTVYGFMIVIGQCLPAMSLMVVTLVITSRYPPMDHALTKKHLHDIGKLLLALVMLWAYLNFAQLLITWSANLPDEVVWYIKRWNGGWGWLSLSLLLFHFCLPFLLLLSQTLKKNPRTIMAIAIFLIGIHMVDVISLIEANFADVKNVQFTGSWLDLVGLAGFGGLFLALYFRNLPQAALMPLGAPDLKKALSHGRDH
jgi:hypothetical protein